MIQRFIRARARKFIAARLENEKLKVRSRERDTKTDHSRIDSAISAIEAALNSAEAEQDGLNKRIEDVLARASVTVGNATDEYLDREPHRRHHLDSFDTELARGEERIRQLSTMIEHFRSVRAAMLSKFPDCRD